MTSSKIFVRHKALGYVTNHIPVVTRYIERRRENLLVACVGKAFHTYSSSHFRLLSVSDLHPEEITCLAGDTFLVYSAAGKVIYAWRRGNELKYKYEGHEYPVKFLLCFGDHLISVDENSNLKVWDIRNETVVSELSFSNEKFQISALMHPSTYLNKILLGSDQGYLQLWNILTSKLIYSFRGWGSGVSAIEQSPIVDVIGVGLKNGDIKIFNIKYDEIVMEFHQDWGIVTCLSFRTDDVPILASGTMDGHIVFWNLDEKKLFSQLLYAHCKSVTGLQCFPCEPLMVSSSPDNSLRLWIFDMPDGGPRLLSLREGHSSPPTCVRFYDARGQNLLSSGGDCSLRSFNTVTEIFNQSLGKAKIKPTKSKKKKGVKPHSLTLPPIVTFAFETTREKEWDNIATTHLGRPEITTWCYSKQTSNPKKLVHKRFKKFRSYTHQSYKGIATSVFITHCGNFVLVGYNTGHCDKFNIQSGLYRGSYGKETAHDGAVRGIAVDILNLMLTTCGSDKTVKWWNFKMHENGKEISKLVLEEAISFSCYHLESALLAVALEDFTITLIDNEGRNVIRKFNAHIGKVNDLCFSPDSKWLISAGMDCSILTWDVPTGYLVDHFKVDMPCTSLSFSPTSEYLATTHVDFVGVFLWSNRTLYTHVTLKPIEMSQDLAAVGLPSTVLQSSHSVPEDETEETDEIDQLTSQINGLVTLSEVESSKWKNLLELDIIKRRNKPKERVIAPATAPFFLPTIPSMDVKFDLTPEEGKSRIEKVSFGLEQNLTNFGRKLKETETSNDFAGAFEKLKKMGPSGIDFEVHSLISGFDTSATLLKQFLKMIKHALASKLDFELAQSYLSIFLKVHGQSFVEDDDLHACLKELQNSQAITWNRIEENLFYNLSVIKALRM